MALGATVSLLLFVLFSYWIELAAIKGTNNSLIVALTTLNLFLTLAYPMAVSFTIEPEFGVGSFMHMCAVSLYLKLYSYHHVM